MGPTSKEKEKKLIKVKNLKKQNEGHIHKAFEKKNSFHFFSSFSSFL